MALAFEKWQRSWKSVTVPSALGCVTSKPDKAEPNLSGRVMKNPS
jgi:hypothetical protein